MKRRREMAGAASGALRSGRRILLFIGGIFTLIGLIGFWGIGVRPVLIVRRAQSWTPVQGVVEKAEVREHHGDKGSVTYRPYVAYRYRFGDREYVSDRLRAVSVGTGDRAAAEGVVKAHPPGSAITVYVDPENPSEAIVERELPPGFLIVLAPLLFLTIGLVLLVKGRELGRTRRLDPLQRRRRVVRFRSRRPLFPALISGFLLAVFVGILVGAPSLPPAAYFTFSGLAMLAAAGVLYVLVITRAVPRVVFEITPGDLCPGAEGAVRWRIEGRADRLRRLSILLRCLHRRAEVRRRGGRAEITFHDDPLFEEEIFSSDRPGEIFQGTAAFRLPADRPPSRHGREDGIEWQFIVRGEIPRSPDLRDIFPFLVYPPDDAD